ncbi:MAG: hypothetical protein ABIH56_05970 [Candidatus Margulisiibacteriota bacterium]
MSERKETGEITSYGLLSGEKLYQVRARQALPILVRQAKAEQSIYYSDLASELGMPNPRNLNYVLGTIGNALQALSKKWGIKAPPIQCLVISMTTGIPGKGIGWFIDDKTFNSSSKRRKEIIIDRMLADIYNFTLWDKVLTEFSLKPLTNRPIRLMPIKAGAYGGVGESEEHRKLKAYIAKHPEIIKISKYASSYIEYAFASADIIDVLFQHDNEWIGVEVKSARSGLEDITRGLFQCIKYRALIEATQISENHHPNARVVLLLEDAFPKELRWLKNILAVEVMDRISPK